jgi:prepilin-type N-terminal cleavage/methylation domain-containing protein
LINRLKGESGYSLVEVMVAIMILAIAIIPMVGMFDAGLRAAVLGGNYDKGRAIANEELEEIRALPFRVDPNPPADSVVEMYPPVNGPTAGGPVTCTGPVDAAFSCQVETTYVLVGPSAIEADFATRTMLEVKVTVRWDGSSKSYTTTGLVSKETQ